MSAILIPLILMLIIGFAVGAAARAVKTGKESNARIEGGAPAGLGGRRIDPFAVGEPWRYFVRDAVQAKSRFDVRIAEVDEGPLKDRLVDIGRRLDDGVEECWRTAKEGHELTRARAKMNVDQLRRQAEALDGDDDPVAERTRRAYLSQIETAERMDVVITDAEARLRLLEAQLDESVARAIEMSTGRGVSAETGLTEIGLDIDHVVEELDALRQALEELDGGPATGTA